MITQIKKNQSHTLWLLLTGLCVLGCHSKYEGALIPVDRNDFMELDVEDESLFSEADFVTEGNVDYKGEKMIDLLGTHGIDLYRDTNDLIRKVVLRPRTYQDDIRQILWQNRDYDPREGIPTVKIRCDSLEYVLEKLYAIQPEEIPELKGGDTLQFFDFGRAIIESVSESCGELTLEKHGKRSLHLFWSMVQHNEKEIRAYYYPYFEEVVNKGHLHPEKLALLTDRLLMEYGYKQVYGSQISNYELYPIRDSASVDVRREAIGLEPLREYLNRFDLNE